LNKRRFYYDENGFVFFENDVYGNATIEQDIATFTALSERNRDTFDVLELPFGAYAQDFAECNGYRVNVETGGLEFSYPNPQNPAEEPVFQPPLSDQVKQMEKRVEFTEEALISLMDML
jgi:hypothetical protein